MELCRQPSRGEFVLKTLPITVDIAVDRSRLGFAAGPEAVWFYPENQNHDRRNKFM